MGSRGNNKKSRRFRMLVLIGLGVAAAKVAKQRAATPARPVPGPVTGPTPVPTPTAAAAPPEAPVAAPVEQPEAVSTDHLHDPVVSAVIGAEDDSAPAHLADVPPAPADSLSSFFEEVLSETAEEPAPQGRRRTKGEPEPTE